MHAVSIDEGKLVSVTTTGREDRQKWRKVESARANYRTFERGPDSLVFPTAIRPTTGSDDSSRMYRQRHGYGKQRRDASA